MVIAHGIQKWIDKKLREGEEKRAAKAQAKGHAKGLEEGRTEGRVEGRVEGLAEGRVEGRAEERKLWTEWNARRKDAEARGEDFIEPPPNGNP